MRDKWGAKRKRRLFSRREELTHWVVETTDKCKGQRDRGCYSAGQRADMIILRGSAEAKRSELVGALSPVSHK